MAQLVPVQMFVAKLYGLSLMSWTDIVEGKSWLL